MPSQIECVRTIKNTNLDLKVVYEICEKHGISKEVVTLFTHIINEEGRE